MNYARTKIKYIILVAVLTLVLGTVSAKCGQYDEYYGEVNCEVVMGNDIYVPYENLNYEYILVHGDEGIEYTDDIMNDAVDNPEGWYVYDSETEEVLSVYSPDTWLVAHSIYATSINTEYIGYVRMHTDEPLEKDNIKSEKDESGSPSLFKVGFRYGLEHARGNQASFDHLKFANHPLFKLGFERGIARNV